MVVPVVSQEGMGVLGMLRALIAAQVARAQREPPLIAPPSPAPPRAVQELRAHEATSGRIVDLRV
jgi:hypothetical protein